MRLTYGALDLTATPYMIEFGSDVGAPQNVSEALAFLLQDGEIELSSRASNRTLQFNVLIEGANLLALATAEQNLILETEKPLNLLTLDPQDSGPATVYEVFRAQVELVRDDDMEMARIRRYSVTVNAYPFVRSAAEVVTPALPATGTTTTLVDNGSATTNWTGTVNGVTTAPAVTSGAVGIITSALSGVQTISLTRTASISTAATPYLMIEWQGPAFGDPAPALTAYGDGVQLEQIGQIASPTSGFTRTWFRATTSSIAVLRLDSTSTEVGALVGPFARSLLIDNINRTDVKPALGTARQLLRSIDIAGSAPTQGSLAIEHTTSSLGDVIAYFFPDRQNAYSPPLRQYRISGGSTSADAAMVSGTVESIVSGFTAATIIFDVPLRNLVAGLHLFQARMAVSGGSNTFSWTAATRVNGTTVGPTLTGTRTLAVTTGGYEIYTLARLNLPTLDVDPASSTAVLRVTLAGTGGSGLILTLDEAWLFNTSIGQHVQVACGTGTAVSGGPARRVFIESPTISTPRPTIRIGHAADRSDSFFPTTMTSWQMPQLTPQLINVFTVTTNALDASVTLRRYRRWHTYAAS